MIHSLNDLKPKKDEKKEKDNRKTTDSYTGGKSSGIAVENPEDYLDNVRRRGEDKAGFEKTKNKVDLKVYKNGFFLNNGPFRPLSKPENQKFMDEVKKGYVPKELIDQGMTDLGIRYDESKKDEDYVEPIPEKRFEAFTGAGVSLGKVNTTGLKVDKNATTNVDKSKPTCKISIRLFNGETVNEEFNLSNTVNDIVKFVEKVSGSHKFQLIDGFPPKPLTELNKTIEELHLQGSMLTQRIG